MADVVATSEVFSSTDALRETWPVIAEVAAGTALIVGTDHVGVAYTPSGGYTETETLGGMTISAIPFGGASLGLLECSVATDGTCEFPVTGATGSTANGTIVYAVVAGNRITSLTLTAGSNTRFGVVNNRADFVPSATAVHVKVGA